MGRERRGVRDGTGPYKGSYQYRIGNRGRKAGMRRGNC